MQARMNYLWRLAGTGFAFLVFGLGGLLLTLFVFPLITLILRDGARREAAVEGVIHLLFKNYINMLRVLGVIGVKIIGGDRLASCKGQLIVANHPSLLDVVLILSLVPRAKCLVKAALWQNFFLGGVVRSAGYIRNDAEVDEIVATSRDRLQAGSNIVLFPEGTRSVPGQPIRFRRGAANIALLAQADIQLVTLTVTPSTLTKGEAWHKIPAIKPQFDIAVGSSLDMTSSLLQRPRSIVARELTRTMEQYFTGK